MSSLNIKMVQSKTRLSSKTRTGLKSKIQTKKTNSKKNFPTLDELNDWYADSLAAEKQSKEKGYYIAFLPRNKKTDVTSVMNDQDIHPFKIAGMLQIQDKFYSYISDSQYRKLSSKNKQTILGQIYIFKRDIDEWQKAIYQYGQKKRGKRGNEKKDENYLFLVQNQMI